MFKRIQFEEWSAAITIIAFFLCFLTFLYFSWRAIRMSKRERDHMANLPLDGNESSSSSSSSSDHEQH